MAFLASFAALVPTHRLILSRAFCARSIMTIGNALQAVGAAIMNQASGALATRGDFHATAKEHIVRGGGASDRHAGGYKENHVGESNGFHCSFSFRCKQKGVMPIFSSVLMS